MQCALGAHSTPPEILLSAVPKGGGDKGTPAKSVGRNGSVRQLGQPRGRGDKATRAPTGRGRQGPRGERVDRGATRRWRRTPGSITNCFHTNTTPPPRRGNSSCSQTDVRTHAHTSADTLTRSHARTYQQPLLIHSCYNLHDVTCTSLGNSLTMKEKVYLASPS